MVVLVGLYVGLLRILVLVRNVLLLLLFVLSEVNM